MLRSRLKNLLKPSTQPSRPLDYPADVYAVPVLLINYFPLKQGRIDPAVTGDVSAPVDVIRRHTVHTTQQVIWALETGSTYHGYRDPNAQPSLRYDIVQTLEFLEPLPTYHKPGHRQPMTDYNAIMGQIDLGGWVEERGVKEVWLWGYHGGVIDLWESNMAGPYGDISNSDRDPDDLPVLSKTYTVYHYNYQRGTSEAVEDHLHQIEALLGFIDSRMFWDRFVGKPGKGRCGWSHYPPNAERDYDWANRNYVWTDIENWTPEGIGPQKRMNCTRWNCDSLTWFIYWMQNLPGAHNGLSYRGRSLSNWWRFIGDFDEAISTARQL
ncbi:MAG: hypothetical protein JSV81_00200 [Anaerolineales bacterium]|nr:MAG: hypothetical protein JSV81_00200 [Anaerolineales bacterium]